MIRTTRRPRPDDPPLIDHHLIRAAMLTVALTYGAAAVTTPAQVCGADPTAARPVHAGSGDATS